MDLLDRMLGHDYWATATFLELSRDLSDEQLDRQFDIGHRTLRETFDHMIYVLDFWPGWMTGRPVGHDRTTLDHERTIPAFIERHDRFHANFAALARRLHDEGRLEETFIDHYNVSQEQGATILQVIAHNQQHRSEIRHILERLGVPDLWDYDPQEWEHVTQRGKPASSTEGSSDGGE